jgi:hypothetical protein
MTGIQKRGKSRFICTATLWEKEPMDKYWDRSYFFIYNYSNMVGFTDMPLNIIDYIYTFYDPSYKEINNIIENVKCSYVNMKKWNTVLIEDDICKLPICYEFSGNLDSYNATGFSSTHLFFLSQEVDFISDLKLVIPWEEGQNKNIREILRSVKLIINTHMFAHLDIEQIYIMNSFYGTEIYIENEKIYIPLHLSLDIIPMLNKWPFRPECRIEFRFNNNIMRPELHGKTINIAEGKKKEDYMGSNNIYATIVCCKYEWQRSLTFHTPIFMILIPNYLLNNKENVNIRITGGVDASLVNASISELYDIKKRYNLPVDDEYSVITTIQSPITKEKIRSRDFECISFNRIDSVLVESYINDDYKDYIYTIELSTYSSLMPERKMFLDHFYHDGQSIFHI